MAIGETARLISSLELDNRKFLRGVSGSLAAAGKLDKGLSRAGRGLGRLGGGLGKAGIIAGGAVVAGLGASAKAAIDFQDAFQGVVKTVDEAQLNRAGLTFDDLSDSIREMAREMPISAIALAGIAEQGGALGIAGEDIAAFTKQVAILASTTNVSADDAAAALGQLQNVIGLTGDEFDNFAADLVALGNAGSSTESSILEIARRAGSAGKLFGIAKDQTLGWAAAAANLGINQELAGTALQNVFIKSLPLFIKGDKKLRDITGKTAKQLKTSFKKDAGGALEDLIKSLGKLDKGERLTAVQDLFGKTSGITRLVLGLADSFNSPTGLASSIDMSTKAWKEATAAQIEFDKRNATVRSAFTRLKNNVIDAAISIGEGMVPALGRAADKLAAFLKDPEFRKQLEGIGADIGKAIDAIDWNKLLNAAKTVGASFKPALDLVLKIADVIAGLPPGVIGGAGALILTDKVTGGAISGGIGGIVGGLGESLAKSLASKIPLFGSAFVQPVFVTNMGVGGVGGGGIPGAAGGASRLTKALVGASIIADIVGVVATQQQVSAESSAHAADVKGTLDVNIKNMNPADLQNALNGVNQGISELQSNPLLTLVQGDALTTLQQMRDDIQSQQNAISQTPEEQAKAAIAFRESEHAAEISSAALKSTTDTGLSEVETATRTGLAGTNTNVRGTTGAVVTAQGAITAAIAANRPIVSTSVAVSVTSSGVERSTTTSTRYGEQNGSAGRSINNDHGKG